MPINGSIDQANNSPIFTAMQFNVAPNTANRDALFGNSTIGAFKSGQRVGVYGMDTTETAVSNGHIATIQVITPGSGYTANTTVTVTGNGTANATANSTGRISAVNVSAVGSGYTQDPTVTVAAPPAITFNALTAVSNAASFITAGAGVYQVNDVVKYLVAAGNTAIAPLANNTLYYVTFANTTGVKLSTTIGGTALALVAGISETGHSLTGETATAVAAISGDHSGAHSGWVLRTEGTGGRAGRVQLETLVAFGSLSSDAADDTFIPDA